MEDGLDWLVRHQREDGSWSLNFQDHCQGTPCPAADRDELGHGGDRAGSLAAAGRRLHSYRQEQAPGGGPPRARVAGRASAARRRPVHGPARARPTCTATPSPRWRFAKASASPATPSSRSRPSAPSSSSSTRRTRSAAAGGTRPGQQGDTSVFGWQIFALAKRQHGRHQDPAQGLEGLQPLPRPRRATRSGSSTPISPAAAPRPS